MDILYLSDSEYLNAYEELRNQQLLSQKFNTFYKKFQWHNIPDGYSRKISGKMLEWEIPITSIEASNEILSMFCKHFKNDKYEKMSKDFKACISAATSSEIVEVCEERLKELPEGINYIPQSPYITKGYYCQKKLETPKADVIINHPQRLDFCEGMALKLLRDEIISTLHEILKIPREHNIPRNLYLQFLKSLGIIDLLKQIKATNREIAAFVCFLGGYSFDNLLAFAPEVGRNEAFTGFFEKETVKKIIESARSPELNSLIDRIKRHKNL